MNSNDPYQNSSVLLFIATLNNFFEEETFTHCFYDFPRQNMKDKNALFIMIERIKQDKKYMKHFCDEMNKKLINYEITSVCNILCGKTYKYPKRTDIPIQINNGYYYSFTVVCKKKAV